MGRVVNSRIVNGKVMHRRHHPTVNSFVYPVFFLLVNLDELPRIQSWLLGINRRRPLSVSFTDYGDGGDPRTWLMELLTQNGITDCDGQIWLQTFPRVLGYLFNPVSFWYCNRQDGSTGAIVAEVNNTFGERHCYVLRQEADGQFRGVRADKRLYVSPFYPVDGSYQFEFNTDFSTPRVRIDYYRDGELQLNTAIWGESRPLTNTSVARSLIGQPLLTIGVTAKIHWQALRLWLKRVPLFDRPKPSEEPSS